MEFRDQFSLNITEFDELGNRRQQRRRMLVRGLLLALALVVLGGGGYLFWTRFGGAGMFSGLQARFQAPAARSTPRPTAPAATDTVEALADATQAAPNASPTPLPPPTETPVPTLAALSGPALLFVPVNTCTVMAVSPQGGPVQTLTVTPPPICWRMTISPDGKRAAFMVWGEAGVYVMNVDGSELKQISTLGTGDLAWSADSSQIVFSASVTNKKGQPVNVLVFAQADGSGEQVAEYVAVSPLFDFDSRLAWSPTGEWVYLPAFQQGDTETLRAAIFSSAGVKSRLLQGTHIFMQMLGSWSPDGKLLAYVTGRDPEREISKVFIWSAAGTQGTLSFDDPLNTLPGPQFEGEFYGLPAWSPDGTRLLVGGRTGFDGKHHLILLTPANLPPAAKRDNGAPVFVFDSDASLGERVLWSPDGSQAAFFLQTDEQWPIGTLMTVNLDGSSPLALAEGVSQYSLVWTTLP